MPASVIRRRIADEVSVYPEGAKVGATAGGGDRLGLAFLRGKWLPQEAT